MPGPEACACTSATRAPLLAPSTQTVPSLCARNSSPAPARGERRAVDKAVAARRALHREPAHLAPVLGVHQNHRSGVLGSANDVPCIIDAAHVAKSRGAGECA